MKRMTLGTLLGATAVLASVGVGSFVLHNEIGPRAAGYHAKVLCSGVFVAGRSADTVEALDLGRFWYVQGDVDAEAKTVKSTLYGFGTAHAIYRDGVGCTVVRGVTPEELRAATPTLPERRDTAGLPWPTGDVGAVDTTLDGIDQAALTAAIDAAFAEPDPETLRRTRAVVVVHRGRIIAERYGPGFTKDTPLLGWSMTKSVTSTLYGLASARDRLDIHEPTGFDAWPDGDPRAALTTDQLLRMSSGLAFDESYDAFGDATRMLFLERSAGRFAASFPLEHDPDTHWSYSSGTTNVLQALLQQKLGEDYATFPHEALFAPLGMRSAVIEPDSSGAYVGSSFMYATGRDWARFGLLYLQDGTWEGERLLPEGWVTYVSTPTPPSNGRYGAQFWLNRSAEHGEEARWPDVPVDAFDASGFEGQNVLIVPSRDAVIVRLGLSPGRKGWDFGAFAGSILDTLPEGPTAAERLARSDRVDEAPVDDAAYVHRGELLYGEGMPVLTREDLPGVLEPDLVLDDQGLRWTGHPDERPVRLRLVDGAWVADSPDAATVRRLLQLAERLDARVTGEHGAHFVSDDAEDRGFHVER